MSGYCLAKNGQSKTRFPSNQHTEKKTIKRKSHSIKSTPICQWHFCHPGQWSSRSLLLHFSGLIAAGTCRCLFTFFHSFINFRTQTANCICLYTRFRSNVYLEAVFRALRNIVVFRWLFGTLTLKSCYIRVCIAKFCFYLYSRLFLISLFSIKSSLLWASCANCSVLKHWNYSITGVLKKCYRWLNLLLFIGIIVYYIK